MVHSTTKFLNGHSDSVGGVAVVKTPATRKWLQYVQNAVGAILSPFDSWLVLRGTKTLALRMPRHEENGREGGAVPPCAAPRSGRSSGRASPITRATRSTSARPRASARSSPSSSAPCEAAERFLPRVRLCSLGESLGGVETLISHPATMTHAGYTQPERDALGITNGLVRISVGCEDADDLLADLGQALEAV